MTWTDVRRGTVELDDFQFTVDGSEPTTRANAAADPLQNGIDEWRNRDTSAGTLTQYVWDSNTWLVVWSVDLPDEIDVAMSAPALAFGSPATSVAVEVAQGVVEATLDLSAPALGFGAPTMAVEAGALSPIDATVEMLAPALAFGSPTMAVDATVSGANDATVSMAAPALAFGAPTMQVFGGDLPADVLLSSTTSEPIYSSTNPADYLTES